MKRVVIFLLLYLFAFGARASMFLQLGYESSVDKKLLGKLINAGYSVKRCVFKGKSFYVVEVTKGVDEIRHIREKFGFKKAVVISERKVIKSGCIPVGAVHKGRGKRVVIPFNKVMNSLVKVKVEKNRIVLVGLKIWEYVETEELVNPKRVIIHLFNAFNRSGIGELLFPLPYIKKIRVVFDPKVRETRVVLYPYETVSIKVLRSGKVVEVYPVVIQKKKETASGKVELYQDKMVSLEFRGADIRDVIRVLSEVSGVNFVLYPQVSGSVTIKLKNVPWEKALDVILKINNLDKIKENGIIIIGPADAIKKERERRIEVQKTKEQLEPLVTEVIELNYATTDEVVSLIKPLLSARGKVDVIKRLNAVMVKDTKSRIAKIKKLIKEVDTPTYQVQISARLVEVSSSFVRELGIQWGFGVSDAATSRNFPYSYGFGGGVSSSPAAGQALSGSGFGVSDIVKGFVVDLPATVGAGTGGSIAASLLSRSQSFGIDIRISAMEEEGLAKVVSTPKVVTMDNEPAVIEQGFDIPYSTVSDQGTKVEFKKATLKLEVKPHVTATKDILLDITITKDSPDFTNITPSGIPIQTRSIKTKVRMKNGDTLVIGGIYEVTKGVASGGIPILRRIPILGWLFEKQRKNVEKRELLIFITPTIVESYRLKE